MSERTVTARLRADTGSFIASMKQAQSATKAFHDDATASATKNKAAWESTGKGMMVAGGVIAAGVGLAVKTFMDFDAAMSQAQAGTMATGASLDALRAAAIDAGAATQFSATEAANAITEMGKAGVSTKDILSGGLNGALALAAAGQLDVGQAAEIAATSMNQFGLEGKDIPHIADLLAAGAGKAMGSVQDLSMALKYAGVVSASAGWSIEETTGVLAEFAQAGIVGEQAGTSIRGVILALQAPSAAAAKTMGSLGINVYDTAGNFLQAAPLAQELHDKLGGLDNATRDAALGQIFGNVQITAARVLYEGGGVAVDKWTKGVNDAGFATKQAAMLTDNLKGDVERLGGSLSSVLIQAGSGANDMLREMTQVLQGAVDLYGSLPVPVQKAATVIGAVTAAALLLGGGMLVLAPKIAATKLALADMGRTGAMMSTGMSKMGSALMGPLGIGLALGTVALGYFANKAQETKARVDELATSLDQETGAITENTTAMVNKRLSDDGTLASAKNMGVATGDVTAAYLGNTDAIARVDAALKAYGMTLAGEADVSAPIAAMDKLKGTIHGGNSELDAATAKTKLLAEANAAAVDPLTGLTGAQKAAGEAAKEATGKAQALVQSEEDLKKSAEDAKKAHDDLKASIEGFGGAMLDARGSARDYNAALRDGNALLKESHRALNADGSARKNHEEAADKENAALDAVRTTALKSIVANFEHTHSVKGLTTEVGAAREAFITMAHKMGMSIPVAKATATELGLTTGNVMRLADEAKKVKPVIPIKVNAATEAAEAKLKRTDATLNRMNGKRAAVSVTLTGYAATYQNLMNIQSEINRLNGSHVRIATGAGGQGGLTVGSADGGPVGGHGGPRQDDQPIWASTGEWVINAASSKKIGPAGMAAINSYANGGPVGYAGGGAVTAASTLLSTGVQYASGMTAGRTAAQVQASIDAISKLTAVWKAAVAVAEALAARAVLVRAIAKASSTEIAAARKALADFDSAAATSRADAMIARRLEILAASQQAAVNKASWAFDHLSAVAQLADVTRRLAAEKVYSDTWMTLAKQREQLAAQIAADAKSELIDLASKLNTMLDARATILGQLSAAQDTYSASVAGANTALADQTRQLEDARRVALATWAKLDSQMQAGFAPSMSFLVSNAKAQISQFTEWMAQLDLARQRGVSESVIASLGLDQGPQALAQLRQFNAGTLDQVTELNGLVATQQQLAGAQVAREKSQMLGELGRGLLAAQQQAAEAVAVAQATFMTSQRELTAQLALVGTDQTRSYTAAVAAGLLAGIPAIRAAALAVQSAMTAETAAEAFARRHAAYLLTPAGVAATARVNARTAGLAAGGWAFGAGSGTSDSIPARLSNGEFVVTAKAAAANGPVLEAMNARFGAGGYTARGNSAPAQPMPTNGATSADIAVLTRTTAALGDRFRDEMQAQARTIETMRRQMVGAR